MISVLWSDPSQIDRNKKDQLSNLSSILIWTQVVLFFLEAMMVIESNIHTYSTSNLFRGTEGVHIETLRFKVAEEILHTSVIPAFSLS